MKRATINGLLLQALGMALLLIGFVAVGMGGYGRMHNFQNLLLVISMPAVAAFFFSYGVAAFIRGSHLRARPAQEVLARGEPYALYLRSFAADPITGEVRSDFSNPAAPTVRLHSEEWKMARSLRVVGEGLAVGAPGEELPPLGFKRLYVETNEWQEKIERLLKGATLVVLRLGDTEGVLWELEAARRILIPERLVLTVPLGSPLTKKPTDRLVELCRGITVRSFKASMVHWSSAVGIIYFGPDWTAHTVPLSHLTLGLKQTFDKAFAPVFKQLNIKLGFRLYRFAAWVYAATLIAFVALFVYAPEAPLPPPIEVPALPSSADFEALRERQKRFEQWQKTQEMIEKSIKDARKVPELSPELLDSTNTRNRLSTAPPPGAHTPAP